MDYTGLISKYRVNRPLNTQERSLRLEQKTALPIQPAYELSVVRHNESFVELVDKFYAWRGFLATACLCTLAALLYFGASSIFDLTTASSYGAKQAAEHGDTGWRIVLDALYFGGFGAAMVWLLRKDAFAYTHYPIRLNRSTRMIHVFRLDGSVLSVPWDEVFFCLGALPQRGWEIQGHVLDADGQTVKETFAFAPHGVGAREREMLKQYWEFVRRYMEDGPQAVASEVKACLPIAERRETFAFGWHRTHYHVGALPLVMQALMLLLYLVVYPGRWFALRTSRIPKWPADVDDSHGAGVGAARPRSPNAMPQELES